MKAVSKRYAAAAEHVDAARFYEIEEAMEVLKQTATANFDEAAEAVFRLNINPRKNEHRIRSTVVLPHGTGKSVRVLAFAKGEAQQAAEDAGADHVGGEELVEKIENEDWFEFDRVVATPDMMSVVGRLGRVLGPRGLMPSPKTGTVTQEIGSAVEELKAGKMEFRIDDFGQIHQLFGRISFETDQLVENFLALATAIVDEQPADVRGRFLRRVNVSSTMGPGIRVNPDEVARRVEEGRL
ncbi:MAG: 50S ribosomal protein L1 [Candidatus Bipolaricaulia bacterium]